MHTSSSPAENPSAQSAALRLVLRTAKHLQRAATSESTAASLPVLRRLLAANVLHDAGLPQLHRERDKVQRKHVLRLLAIEAGHANWESYRAALAHLQPDELQHFDLLRANMGYPNLWFSTFEQAQAHASAHGGKALRVGTQAVVSPAA